MNARLIVALVLAGAAPAAAQENSVTIFTSGSAFVRRAIPSPVPRGMGTHVVDLGMANIDPGALVALDAGVAIRSARIAVVAGRQASLQRAIGRDLDFATGSGDSLRFRRGTLLSIDPPAVRWNGRVFFSMPGEPTFPDSLAQLNSRLELSTESARSLPSLRLGYFTGGLSWRASYTAVMPRRLGGAATVSGTATISDADLTLRGAEVQLVSGDIRRDEPAPMLAGRVPGNPAMAAMRIDAITVTAADEAVGEVRTYTLPGRHDLLPGTTVAVPLFDQTSAEVELLYPVRSRRDVIEPWVDYADSNMHPDVVYRVRRPAGSAFGDLAIPAGLMRVFAPDSAGRLQLLGEVGVGATPRGRDLEVTTGTAADIVVDRIQTLFERRGERDVVAAYRVTVHNAKDEPATVTFDDGIPGRWEVQSSTIPPERLSSTLLRFTVPVTAGGEQTLEYRLRVRW